MNTIIKLQSREAWLAERTKGIGSSEVPSILGINPYQTPYQLWRYKTGLDGGKVENFAMKAGHYLEDAVAQFYIDETKREVIKNSAGDFLIINNDRPYLRVSPDRLYWIPGEKKNRTNKGILECKTTQMSIDPDDLPKSWFSQLQYQLGVAELYQGSLAWLQSGRSFDYKDYEFVPDFYEWMREEVAKFWNDNILGGKEPDAISSEDIQAKYSRHTEGKAIEVAEDVHLYYRDLIEIREKIAKAEEDKLALEERLKMTFQDAESIAFRGQTLATWKAPKESKKLDADALKIEHPEIYSKFLKTTQGARRFLLK